MPKVGAEYKAVAEVDKVTKNAVRFAEIPVNENEPTVFTQIYLNKFFCGGDAKKVEVTIRVLE